MYSKSEDAAEDEDAEGKKEESSTVDFVLTIVSLFLILITFPFSIWKCVKVMFLHCKMLTLLAKESIDIKKVPRVSDARNGERIYHEIFQVAQEYERVVILRLGRLQKNGVKYRCALCTMCKHNKNKELYLSPGDQGFSW